MNPTKFPEKQNFIPQEERSGLSLHINAVVLNYLKIFQPEFENNKRIYESQFRKCQSICLSSFHLNKITLKCLQFFGFLRKGETLSPFESPPKPFFYEKKYALFLSQPSLVTFDFTPLECQQYLCSLANRDSIKKLEQFIDLFYKFIPGANNYSPARSLAYIRWKLSIKILETDAPSNSLELLIEFCKEQKENEKVFLFAQTLEKITGTTQINTQEEITEFYYALTCLIIEEGLSNPKLIVDCLNSLKAVLEESLLQKLVDLFSSTPEKNDLRGKAIREIIEYLFPKYGDIANLLFKKAEVEVFLPSDFPYEIKNTFQNRPISQKKIVFISPEKVEVEKGICISQAYSSILLFFEQKILNALKEQEKNSANNALVKYTTSYANTLETVLKKCKDTENFTSFKSYLFIAWFAYKILKQKKQKTSFSLKTYPWILNWLKIEHKNLKELVFGYPTEYEENIFQELKDEAISSIYYENEIREALEQIKICNGNYDVSKFNRLKQLLGWSQKLSLSIPQSYELKFSSEIESIIHTLEENYKDEQIILCLSTYYNQSIPFIFPSRKASKKIQLIQILFSLKKVTNTIMDFGITLLVEFFKTPIENYEGSKEKLFENLIEHLTKGSFPIAWKILMNKELRIDIDFMQEKFRENIIRKFCEVGLEKYPEQSTKILLDYFENTKDVSAWKTIKYLLGKKNCKNFYPAFICYIENNGIKNTEEFSLFFSRFIEEEEDPHYLLDLFFQKESILKLINLKNTKDLDNLSLFCDLLLKRLNTREMIIKVHGFFSFFNFFSFSFIQKKGFYDPIFEKALYFNETEIALSYLDKISGETLLKIAETEHFENCIVRFKRSQEYAPIFQCLLDSKVDISVALDKIFPLFFKLFVNESPVNNSIWHLFNALLKKYPVIYKPDREAITQILLEYIKIIKSDFLPHYVDLIEKFQLFDEELTILMFNKFNDLKLKEYKCRFLIYMYKNCNLISNKDILEILILNIIKESPIEFKEFIRNAEKIIPILKKIDPETNKKFIEHLFAIMKCPNVEKLVTWCQFTIDLDQYSESLNWVLLIFIGTFLSDINFTLFQSKEIFDRFKFFFNQEKVFSSCLERISLILKEKNEIDMLYSNSVIFLFLLHNNNGERQKKIERILFNLYEYEILFQECTKKINNLDGLVESATFLQMVIKKINENKNHPFFEERQKKIINELKKFSFINSVKDFSENLNFKDCFFLNDFCLLIESLEKQTEKDQKKLLIQNYEKTIFTNFKKFKVLKNEGKIHGQEIQFTCFLLYFINRVALFIPEKLVDNNNYLKLFNNTKNHLNKKYILETLIYISPSEFCQTKEFSNDEKFTTSLKFFIDFLNNMSNIDNLINYSKAIVLFNYMLFQFNKVNIFLFFNELQITEFMNTIFLIEIGLASILERKKSNIEDVEYLKQIRKIIININNFLILILNNSKSKSQGDIVIKKILSFVKNHFELLQKTHLFFILNSDKNNTRQDLFQIEKVEVLTSQMTVVKKLSPYLEMEQKEDIIESLSKIFMDKKNEDNKMLEQIKNNVFDLLYPFEKKTK